MNLDNLNACFLFLNTSTLSREIKKLRSVTRYPLGILTKLTKPSRTKRI